MFDNSLLPSISYPPAQAGYWEPVTSTINWCEEDYYLTIYSAEIVNTFTNLMFMYLAYRGIRNCLKQGHAPIFLVSFIGYLIVSTGSFLFHSTLKYPMQLIDELSMIYTTCIAFYASFERARSTSFKVFLAASLIALSIGITGYYHYVEDPLFHQVAYGILTAIVFFRSLYTMETYLRPSRRTKDQELALVASVAAPTSNGYSNRHTNGHANAHTTAHSNGATTTTSSSSVHHRASTQPETTTANDHDHDNDHNHNHNHSSPSTNGHSLTPASWPTGLSSAQAAELRRIDARDAHILGTMWTMIPYGLAVFLGGFAIWNLDQAYCGQLRSWRRTLGLPWGIVLEGHGWWHLMTGVGAYFYIVWGIWLRYCLDGRQDEVRLVWPRLITSFPEVVKVGKPLAQAQAQAEDVKHK